MLERCSSCIHFQGINTSAGYCTFLGIMTEKGIAILDSNIILGMMKDSAGQNIYNFIVVESSFGCVYYKRMVVQ